MPFHLWQRGFPFNLWDRVIVRAPPVLAGPEFGVRQQARQSPPVSCPTARVSQAGFRELAFLSPPYNPTGISAIGYIQPNFALENRLIYLDRILISLTCGTVLHRRMRFWPQKMFGLFVDSYTTSPFSSAMKNMAVICKSCFSLKSRLAQRSTNSCYENTP